MLTLGIHDEGSVKVNLKGDELSSVAFAVVCDC